MDANKASIDSLLEDLGGCGLFQILIVVSVYGSIVVVAWSLMFMAYGAYNPGWSCDYSTGQGSNITTMLDLYHNVNNESVHSDQQRVISTTSCKGYSHCKNVVFSNDSSTIVTEWGLACDQFYTTSSIISIQMAGVFLGTFIAGPLNNYFGRKPTHFLTLATHAVLHLITMFSVNWQMFATLRFFAGMTSGCVIVTAYLYPIEFINRRWRSVISSLPFWNSGSLLFAATAMVLRSWKYLHLATAILSVLLILPICWVPESLRWLAVKGRIEKAHRVGASIGKINRQQLPNMDVISMIAEEEKKCSSEKSKVTVLDLYRRQFIKRTVITSLMWICFTIVYYAIVYGVKSLSGNFYINLMITSCITTISYPFGPLLSNTVGRKIGCLIFMGLADLGCICLVILHFASFNIDKGFAVLLLTFFVLICTDGAWAVCMTYTVELFPTSIRSLGLSNASSLARIGGMIAPFLIPKDESTLYISHIAMAIVIMFVGILTIFLPETKSKQMQDSMAFGMNQKEMSDMKTGNGIASEECESLA